MTNEPVANSIVILIPVFNDLDALTPLLQSLERVLSTVRHRVTVLVVDDGSPQRPALAPLASRTTLPIRMLLLRRNLGHQRAIAVGLAYIHQHVPCDGVLVMDGDGEDRPEDVPRLIEEFERVGRTRVIFAERTRRSERLVFRVFYHLYRLLHVALTGIKVRFGNFSIVPFTCLSSLVVSSELWNHYAAAVLKTRLPYQTIHTSRGQRLAGKSSLNFVALVVHGLSAISVFGDIIGVRLLMAGILLMGALVALAAVLAIGYLLAGLALPAWTFLAAAVLALIVCQIVLTSCMLVVFVLGSRASTSVIPLRDYEWFVLECVDAGTGQSTDERFLVSRS